MLVSLSHPYFQLNHSTIYVCQVIEEPYLKVLYTAEEKYSLKKSFYSCKTSTSNSAVRPSQYLTMAVDAEDKRHLEEQISVRPGKI